MLKYLIKANFPKCLIKLTLVIFSAFLKKYNDLIKCNLSKCPKQMDRAIVFEIFI